MNNVKFGMNQFGKPLPAKTTKVLGITAFIFSTLSSYMSTATYIPASLSSSLQGIMSLGSTICLGLIPFYGVQQQSPAEEIKTIT